MRFSWLFFIILICSCGAPSERLSTSEDGNLETGAVEPVLEEQLPDSGLLKSVDPEQIMTDDWSDDGDIELDIEEKQ